MMRKEVKLGFAVGGVLLAVIVVYVVAVGGGNNKPATDAPADSASAITPHLPGDPKTAPAAVTSAEQTTRKYEPAKPAPVVEKPTPAPVADSSKNSADTDWAKLLSGNGDQPMVLMNPSVTPAPAPKPETHLAPAPTPEVVTKPPVTPEPAVTQPPAPTTPGPVASNNTEILADPPPPQPVAVPAGVSSTRPSAPATPTNVATAGARTHIVKTGETLSSISAAAYGSANFYPHIIRRQPQRQPQRPQARHHDHPPRAGLHQIHKNHRRPRRRHRDPDAVAGRPLSSPAATFDANKEYKVQPGDSLYRISIKLYGKSTVQDKIYELNKQQIGSSPEKVKAGQVLKLPEPPTVAAEARH